MSRVYWGAAILLTIAIWLISAWVYPQLPAEVPTHWNLEGKVDGWGHKGIATILMPAVMTGMLLFFRFMPALSPKSFTVDEFKSTSLYIMVIVTLLFAYLHAVILMATWQELYHDTKFLDLGRAMLAGIFLFFALIGNVMGKIRKNFYIGIRVPWTLASDRVWNDTHRLAAWLMVGGGVLGFLMVIARTPVLLAFAVMVPVFVIPIVYSFLHYKSLERRNAL